MRFATHDGPGIRTAVFFKGCPLECWWCHNPEGQKFQPEVLYSEDRCRRCLACVGACPSKAIEATERGVRTTSACTSCGTCQPYCGTEARQIAGRRVRLRELMQEIERDLVFFEESGGGVTLSGGEPVCQSRFTAALLAECRRRRIHTTLETCGFAREEVFLQVALAADLVLFDLKIMDGQLHRYYTGVSNGSIQRNLEGLIAHGRPPVVRIPVVPGVNDSDEEIKRFVEYLAPLHPPRIELLAYHLAGLGKYQRLTASYRLRDTPEATANDVGRFVNAFERAGLNVVIGG